MVREVREQRSPRLCLMLALSWAVGSVACDAKDEAGKKEVATEEQPQAQPGAVRAVAKIDGPRMIILGFDGVDPRRVDDLIAQGRLPNIAKMTGTGTRAPLATTNPPQSPVAWSAFATGMGAGRHGVFDFVNRDLRSMFPEVATTRVRHAEVNGSSISPATAENLRRGPSFWDVIARAGIPVRTLAVPYAYPPPTDGAASLGGLGTPDVRGTNSVYTYFTTDAEVANGEAPSGGQLALLQPIGEGAWRATVQGPRINVDGKATTASAQMIVRTTEGGLAIELGRTPQTVAVGSTGPYVEVAFVPTPDMTILAQTRATVRAGAPKPEIYLEPLSIDPNAPYLPVSSPPELAVDLWTKHGAFKTVGWVDDTSALGNGAMDEAQFIAEAMATMKRQAAMTLAAANSRTDRVLVSAFTAPDRIGHMFFRYIDPKHPAPKDGDIAACAAALDGSYDEMDRIVGEISAASAPGDILLVMSDHGFGSFRRGFHLNRWLVDQGYLVLKPTKKPKDFFLDVDWAQTKAYGMGTGSIYVNVKGREREGSVAPGDARAVAEEIASKIKTVKDGDTQVVVGAYFGDDIYDGPERRSAPDLRIALADGWRASWATTLGGIPNELFEDNTKKWSGDHASADPEAVPGILFANVPVRTPARIEDLAATAYDFTGVKPPPGVVGSSLLQKTAVATEEH